MVVVDAEMALLCQKALSISQTGGIIAALALKVTFATIGFFAQLYVSIWKNHFSKTFNRNARLLLNLHYAFVIISCFGTIASDGFDFFRLTIGKSIRADSDCLVPPISPVTGVSLKIVKLFGTSGTSLSMFALTIERIYATLAPQTYQKVSIKFGVFLASLTIIANLICFALHAYYADYSQDVYLTTITKGAMQMSLYMLYCSIGIEIFVILAQSVLMLVNVGIVRGNNQILKSLNYKSQIRENVESLKYLCSLSFIHACLYLVMAILMPTVANVQTDETKKQLTTITTEVITIYFVALPLVYLWRSFVKTRSTRLVQAIHYIGDNENRVKMENTKHFELLDQMLNKRR